MSLLKKLSFSLFFVLHESLAYLQLHIMYLLKSICKQLSYGMFKKWLWLTNCSQNYVEKKFENSLNPWR